MDKMNFEGLIRSVQPRIRLGRSFDQTHHNYLGFALLVEGMLNQEPSVVWIGIGKAAQARHLFQVGDSVSGECLPVADARLEPVGYYKVSKLQKTWERNSHTIRVYPPWTNLAPELETYRARGHRRLDARTYKRKCMTCKWGCRMPVEIVVDHWNPGILQYRFETFCYGPKNCPFYKPGPKRKVPGRGGNVFYEEDWVDEENTRHRGKAE